MASANSSARSRPARVAAWLLFSLALVLPAAGCGPPATPTPPSPSTATLPEAAATPTSLLRPSPSPSPSPRPTLSPGELHSAAEQLLRRGEALWADGDHAGALAAYEQIRSAYPDTPAAAESLLRTARTYLEMGRPLSATLVLTPALEALPEEARHRAVFLLAEALRQSDSCPLAIPLYLRYREEGTAMEDLVAERLAWCYRALGDNGRAAEEFARAAGPCRSAAEQVGALEEAARQLRATAAYTDALARYEQILSIARYPWYRAAILFRMGETLQQAGKPEEARSRWQELLSAYPQTAAAAQAADALLAAGAVVDPYLAGQAYAAVGRTDEAVAQMEEAWRRSASPPADLRYALARARADQGDLAGALGELDGLIAAAPTDPDPLMEQGRLQAAAGAVDGALQTYALVAERFPRHPSAGEALYQAGLLLEEQGLFDRAVAAWGALLERFPRHGRAAAARFRAGLLRYRQRDFEEAAALWAGEEGADFPRAALWRGLALARLGRQAEARRSWAAAAAGSGYYAARAKELLSAGPDFGQFQQTPAVGTGFAERREAEAWLEESLGQPVSRTLPQRLRHDPCFRRGQELLDLGLDSQARQPFHLLSDRFSGDGPALYALALYLHEQGLYAQSILCTYRLLDLAHASEAESPTFLLRLLYPLPYAHLILPQAREQGVDPFLVFSLVRQESLFDRYATSWAEARGLTQVIPSTGEWIAATLGYTPFSVEDLYRPLISVRFGTWYIGQGLRDFAGQAIPALAGYNGGPGNARRWAEGQVPVPDLDLFVEQVDFAETQDYIQRVYTYYWTYRRLYAPAGSMPP